MRKAASVLLAILLAGPPVQLQSAPALGMIQGLVSVEGRPLKGVELVLLEVESGSISRVTSGADGTFQAQVSPGRYAITTENRAGLSVRTAPTLIPVGSGQVASTRVELLAMPLPLVQEPTTPASSASGSQEGTPAAQPNGVPVINHDPVGCLIAGEFPLLDATIEPATAVARARVYFKSNLGNAYYYIEMTQVEGKFFGKLPRPRIEASPLTYYIQATSTEFGESQTPEIQAIVVAEAKDCPSDKKVAAIGPPGPVQVFSAVTGAAISPAGFAAGGLAIAGGALALIIGGAAAAGVVAAITVFNPSPTPKPTPLPTPTPTPVPTPKPSPSPHASPSPPPPHCPSPPPCLTPPCPRLPCP